MNVMNKRRASFHALYRKKKRKENQKQFSCMYAQGTRYLMEIHHDAKPKRWQKVNKRQIPTAQQNQHDQLDTINTNQHNRRSQKRLSAIYTTKQIRLSQHTQRNRQTKQHQPTISKSYRATNRGVVGILLSPACVPGRFGCRSTLGTSPLRRSSARKKRKAARRIQQPISINRTIVINTKQTITTEGGRASAAIRASTSKHQSIEASEHQSIKASKHQSIKASKIIIKKTPHDDRGEGGYASMYF